MNSSYSSDQHHQLVDALISRWPENHPQPSLGRITALCHLLGEPQQAFPVIQITGTNGKGSTAIMIEALLTSLGLRVGRFSSPHLNDVCERICIDTRPISHEDFDRIWDEIRPMVAMVDQMLIDQVPMTFFEVITAMAYAAFADAPVDVAVVEVGMGGRWDATSVVVPAVSVIGPIDLDHTHLLGSSIEQIAIEKSHIIKHGSVAVMAGQEPAAAAVLMKRCAEVGAAYKREGIDFNLLDRAMAVGGQMLRIEISQGAFGDLFMPVLGEHMAHNAALALASVEAFMGDHSLEPGIIADGFAAVKAPARLEQVDADPVVVIDTAHNPHGVRATLKAMTESYIGEPLIAVVAMMRDKSVGQVLDLLAECCDEIVCTTIPDMARALSVDELVEKASESFSPGRVRYAASPEQAIDLAKGVATQSGPDCAVLVVGSVYLAGSIRHYVLGDRDLTAGTPDVVVDHSFDIDDEDER